MPRRAGAWGRGRSPRSRRCSPVSQCSPARFSAALRTPMDRRPLRRPPPIAGRKIQDPIRAASSSNPAGRLERRPQRQIRNERSTPLTMLDATAAPLGADARAFVLLKSRGRSANPKPACKPPSTRVIGCRHGPPRTTRSTNGPIDSRPPPKRSTSSAGAEPKWSRRWASRFARSLSILFLGTGLRHGSRGRPERRNISSCSGSANLLTRPGSPGRGRDRQDLDPHRRRPAPRRGRRHPAPSGARRHVHQQGCKRDGEPHPRRARPGREPYCLVNDLGRETIPDVADFLHTLGYSATGRTASPTRRDNALLTIISGTCSCIMAMWTP